MRARPNAEPTTSEKAVNASIKEKARGDTPVDTFKTQSLHAYRNERKGARKGARGGKYGRNEM